MSYSIFENLKLLREALLHLDEEGVVIFESLGTDEHGLARCGVLDSSNFDIWSTTMPFLSQVPLVGAMLKKIGPTYVVTNRECFNVFIRDLDKNADYAGNNSVIIINKQVSNCTVFSTPNREKHTEKRQIVKEHFSAIDQDDISNRIYSFFACRFGPKGLGSGKDVVLHDLLTDLLVEMFGEFITHNSTNNGVMKRCIDEFQEEASSMSVLKCRPYTPAHLYKSLLCGNEALGDDDTLALIKVGFGNLHSMLTTLIRYLASNFALLKELLGNGDISFKMTEDTPASRFFAACYTLAPPVWIMGRKVGDEPMTVGGVELSPYTLLVVPWFHMLRQQYGSTFDLNKFTKDDLLSLTPFSVGANSCIGRYLAIPIMENVIQTLLTYNVQLVSACDAFEGAVFLRYKTSPVIRITRTE